MKLDGKRQCEIALMALVRSAQLAYRYSEDEAYKAIKKTLNTPRVINAIAKTLEQQKEGAKK